MNKTWSVIITIIITAVIVGGGIYYYLNTKAAEEKSGLQSQIDELEDQVSNLQSKSSATEADDIETVEDETADWQTYTNNNYNYSFKYPNNVEVANCQTHEQTTSQVSEMCVIVTEENETVLNINVTHKTKAGVDNLDDYSDSLKSSNVFDAENKILLGGAEAYEGKDQGMLNYYGIVAESGNYFYQLSFSTDNSDTTESLKNALSITQSGIISTFDFSE